MAGVVQKTTCCLPDGYPTENDRVSIQADCERTARLSKESATAEKWREVASEERSTDPSWTPRKEITSGKV